MDNEKFSILITGTNGFVGMHLAKKFMENGHGVIGINRKKNQELQKNPLYTGYELDIRAIEKIQEVASRHKPTHIIHLVFLIRRLRDLKQTYDINVQGSKGIAKLANETPSVRQFINFSTIGVYGASPGNKGFLKETHPLRKDPSTYLTHKQLVEEYLGNLAHRSNLKIISLRMASAVGPSSKKPFGPAQSFKTAPFLIKLDGVDTKVQFIHEDDIWGLVDLITKNTEIEGVYNMTPPGYTTITEIAKTLNKKTLYVPSFLVKTGISLAWKFRLGNLPPQMVNMMLYAIIGDGSLLTKTLNYKYKYKSLPAILDAMGVH